MDAVYNRIRSIDTKNNRWIVPVGAILLGVVVIGLATMFVAPMFRKETIQELENQGRDIKKRAAKRANSTAHQIKDAVNDAAETVQDRAAKAKRTTKKKIKE
jgi:gas vesicle protein